MRRARFHTLVKMKCEPELQSAIVAAAERDCTTVSEFLRRHMRAALSPFPADAPPASSGAASAMPRAA